MLLLLPAHDAPKIEEQNSKFMEQVQGLVNVKMEEVKGVDHFTIVEDLYQVDSESSQALLSFMHAT